MQGPQVSAVSDGLRGAWETFTRDEIAILVEFGDVAVVRVVGVEPCLCFGIRGEVAAVLCISMIPRDRRLRRGGGDDDAGVGALVGNGGDAGVGDTIDVVTDDQSPAGGSSIRLHQFASGCLDVHDAIGTGRIRPTHAGQVGGQIDRRSAIGGGESNHDYSGCLT